MVIIIIVTFNFCLACRIFLNYSTLGQIFQKPDDVRPS